MSDLRGARTNAAVEEALMSREIFDPSDLDEIPAPTLLAGYDPPPSLDADEDMTVVGWRLGPRMPWEVMP